MPLSETRVMLIKSVMGALLMDSLFDLMMPRPSKRILDVSPPIADVLALPGPPSPVPPATAARMHCTLQADSLGGLNCVAAYAMQCVPWAPALCRSRGCSVASVADRPVPHPAQAAAAQSLFLEARPLQHLL